MYCVGIVDYPPRYNLRAVCRAKVLIVQQNSGKGRERKMTVNWKDRREDQIYINCFDQMIPTSSVNT